ncbi:hypothetical protein [Atopomonas hussainii]|uniref:hypothetical protein n=1 Tax=Atopomonas hussainii TaxID=1429083 RepID=UPI000942F8DE|nr:hypothetical protein [Atopomonas hussainii]
MVVVYLLVIVAFCFLSFSKFGFLGWMDAEFYAFIMLFLAFLLAAINGVVLGRVGVRGFVIVRSEKPVEFWFWMIFYVLTSLAFALRALGWF